LEIDVDGDENGHIEVVQQMPKSVESTNTEFQPRTQTETATQPDSIKEFLPPKENPFASFAFKESASEPTKRPLLVPPVQASNRAASNSAPQPKAKKPKLKGKPCEFIKMKDIEPDKQRQIAKKWHDLVDPDAPLEVRRFQMLVAARLHARCQEPSVRKAMKALRFAFPELNVSAVAEADSEVLAQHIMNLQFYNVKAKQLVVAAKEIQLHHGGVVPEDEHSLLKITGIGISQEKTKRSNNTQPNSLEICIRGSLRYISINRLLMLRWQPRGAQGRNATVVFHKQQDDRLQYPPSYRFEAPWNMTPSNLLYFQAEDGCCQFRLTF